MSLTSLAARAPITAWAVVLTLGVGAAVLGQQTGCTRPSGDSCSVDADCDPAGVGGRGCKLDEGICICTTDSGCDPGEHCNVAGRCQVQSSCTTSDDCGAGQFCNILDGNCLADDTCGAGKPCCTVDSQCGYASICDAITLACTPGCREDGDCLLGQGCLGAAFGRLGQCSGACVSDAFCPSGHLCNLQTGACTLDTRGPYCVGCSGGVQSDDCGDYGNYCLLDTVNGGSYCGVDCHEGQGCPRGYACRDVIILPASTLPTCTLPEACVDDGAQRRCARTRAACAVDEDCPEGPPGSDCPRADVGNCELDPLAACSTDAECPDLGRCLKQECRERESASYGICSCTRDIDCPRDRCQDADLSDPDTPVVGHCELSGHACYADLDCDIIACVEGGCRLGQNCKPANDRTCADLLGQ